MFVLARKTKKDGRRRFGCQEDYKIELRRSRESGKLSGISAGREHFAAGP